MDKFSPIMNFTFKIPIKKWKNETDLSKRVKQL